MAPQSKRGPGRPPKGEHAQPVLRYVSHAESLQKAFGLVALDRNRPEELAPDWWQHLPRDVTDAQTYRDWLLSDPVERGDEPRIAEVDKRAARLSIGRAPGGQGRKPITSPR